MAVKQKENPNLLSHHFVQGLTLAFQRAFHMFKTDFECGCAYVCFSMYVRICNWDPSITFHEVFVRNIFFSQGLGFPCPILSSVFCKIKITKMLKCGSAEKGIVFLCPVAAFLSCQSLAVLRCFLYCKHFPGDLMCLLAELVACWEITTHPSRSVVPFGISVMC